ncbi:hypothetical protein [Brucella pseudogrignonensis]|jgi:hypothetical protein|uniref:hypothetical protein n=1 Tax=Brucella pseudogrignonensis TaxID=419475 RepID=UPI000DD8F450
MIADLASTLIIQSIVGPSALVQNCLKVSLGGNRGSPLETFIKQLHDAVFGVSQSTISRYDSGLISQLGRAKNPRFWKIQPNAGLNLEFTWLNAASAGVRVKKQKPPLHKRAPTARADTNPPAPERSRGDTVIATDSF